MNDDGRTNTAADGPIFEPNPDAPGVRIWDPIDKGSFVFHTPSPVSPRPVETDGFPVPIDSAVELRTDRLEIPERIDFNVWTAADGITDRINPHKQGWRSERPIGYLEIPSAPMKLYLDVDCPLFLREEDGTIHVELDAERTISIGCRSHSESPAGTITVTDDIADVMRAVSLLGSALKTTGPERSFPTLRGHPPLIERGDEFSAPAGLERPETDVRLVLPPERSYVYAATPLAYYLGADVVPGRTPRLETPLFERSLDGDGGFEGFEAEVSRAFRHVFFLDCVVREEGFYEVPVHERRQVEPLVGFDFSSLYRRSLVEQLASYFDVPFDVLEPYLPTWHLTMDVVPSAENVEVLPFVADELPLVRCPSSLTEGRTEPQPTAITDFCRSVQSPTENDVETRSVIPDPATTTEHVWVGDGVPIGSNKATIDSYRRRIDRTDSDRSTIRVQIVCNDPMMKSEGKVRDVYRFRDTTRHEVDIAYDVTVDDLRSLFAENIDFLHYIGHVDHGGIECTDGVLDTKTLEIVNVESFLLNACRSYQQGAALVDGGCRAGVATLSDVSNEPATKMGCLLARGLGAGFSFRTALSIARSRTLSGDQYVTIGDGGMTLCLAYSVTSAMLFVDDRDDGTYSVWMRPYPAPRHRAGSISGSMWDDDSRLYLDPESQNALQMTADELDRRLAEESTPVKYDGDLYWSDDITTADLH